MKKLLLALALVVLLVTPAFAQWGGGLNAGGTEAHRDGLTNPDYWYTTREHSMATDSSLELKGYNSVRLDFDVTGIDVQIQYNLMCSNDSLWVSGDSTTATVDSWATFDLMGCKDYNVYVETISDGDEVTVFTTPYNE